MRESAPASSLRLVVAIASMLVACAPTTREQSARPHQAGSANLGADTLVALAVERGGPLETFIFDVSGYDGVARATTPLVRVPHADGRVTLALVGEGSISSNGSLLVTLIPPGDDALLAIDSFAGTLASDPAVKMQVLHGVYTEGPDGLTVVVSEDPAFDGGPGPGGIGGSGAFVYVDRDVTLQALGLPGGSSVAAGEVPLFKGWNFVVVDASPHYRDSAALVITRGDPRELDWHLIDFQTAPGVL